MIQTEKLVKNFEGFIAVDSVDLDIAQGEVLALLGPNGAGKTTTVRMLTSVLTPTSGKAFVAGYDVVESPEKVRSAVGVLTENHGLYNRMPAEEYLDFFGRLYSIDGRVRKERISKLFSQFGLAEFSKKRVGEFSKGMRQKLALARSLLHDPKVLLLDEPTSAMDPESARLVRNMIKDLRSEQRTVLICTHNLAEAEELADRIAIIRQGKIIEKGTPNALKERLLGLPQYEIKFTDPLPEGFTGNDLLSSEIEIGEDWLRFRSSDPQRTNPAIIRKLVDGGLKIVYLKQLPQSLESIYLQAVANGEGNHAV
ncbi:ABC transporter ATP-binding protein [bacterium]|nr:ABC transporter ATP-binding protein [bacterium]